MSISKLDFMCSKCGSIFGIINSDAHMKKLYSTKILWCHSCMEETIHINLIDSSLWKRKLENNYDITKEEQELLELYENKRVLKRK